MAEEYTKEELLKLYEKLPEDLKKAIFSTETADNIYDTCVRNKIEDDRISKVAKFTGWVLLGILSPEDFQNTLEEELIIEKEAAETIAKEIAHLVFYPVKLSLEQLYKIGTVPIEEIAESPTREEKPEIIKGKSKLKRRDIYKELIE